MIKKITKIFIITISLMIILMMILSKIFFNDLLLPFKFGKYIFTYKYANYMINKENDEIEKENKEKNEEAAKQYIKAKYGEAVSSIIEIEYKGRISGWAADSHYIISAPFVDDASIYVESETQDVRGGFNFSKSPKFQHLYSEWVKKQIGVDDENVELKIGFSTSGLDFRKINKLSNDYSEIFRAIEKFEVMDVYIKNQTSVNENNVNDIARDYYRKFFSLNKNISGKTYYVYIIRYDCDINDFMNSRKGDYYTCCFEEGMLKYAKNRYI